MRLLLDLKSYEAEQADGKDADLDVRIAKIIERSKLGPLLAALTFSETYGSILNLPHLGKVAPVLRKRYTGLWNTLRAECPSHLLDYMDAQASGTYRMPAPDDPRDGMAEKESAA